MRRVPVLCAVALGVLTVLVAARWGPLIRFDTAVSAAARRFALHHDGWRSAMSVVTHSADSRVLLPAAVLLAAALLVRRRRIGLLFLLSTAVTATAIRLALLALVHRPRPVDRLTPTSGWAFPSGHTTSSAVAAGVLIVLGCAALTGRWSRRVLVAVVGGWAVLVGVSRVALLAHWPTDVLAGWLLATAVTVALAQVLRVQRSFSTGRQASPQRDAGRSHRPEGSPEWNTSQRRTDGGASSSSPPASAPGTTAPRPNWPGA
ncbi:phosphatase PAP2 family protein [Dactylosporangium sp. NPDC049525]|uniref:phosphatase PAP2 family protein n=1 Tax=Dactylosporangium sp. NPDC049525 TaxID=3154730 RepID=UPI00341C3EBF